MLTIGLFPNPTKEKADKVLNRVIDFLKPQPVRIVMRQETAEAFGYPEYGYQETEYDKIENQLDVGVSIGGDGTLLAACRCLAKRNVPICGINIGRVGFLADIELADIESKLDKLLHGEYHLEERMMVAAIIKRDGKQTYVGSAINDVVVTKGGYARMLTLGLKIDDCRVAHYQADGMIISTSTGSTGYSLSAGGPLINPRLNLLLVTPICPHTMNARPMILSQDEEIKINVSAAHKDIVLTFDGQECVELLPGDTVIAKRSPLVAQIVKFSDINFYATIKSKLGKDC